MITITGYPCSGCTGRGECDPVCKFRKKELAPNREAPGLDGSVRKAHYGEGKQPWDYIVEASWAPEFAAGCILRYLRRDKAREHSVESARWYWARLNEMAEKPVPQNISLADVASWRIKQLRALLTTDEIYVLEVK